jgi:transcriptional regulator with XRE-family HTH domain
MDIREIRKCNLKRLIGDDTHAVFAERAGMNTSHVSQILNGKSNIGNNLARKIEANLGLTAYMLDEDGALKRTTINVEVLSKCIAGSREAARVVGRSSDHAFIAKLAASAYALYDDSGVLIDFEQAANLAALDSD